MYLRHSTVRKNGKTHTYWRLVRSVRTGTKVRQETVAQLGELDAEGRVRAQALAASIAGVERQPGLFEEEIPAGPMRVVLRELRLERGRRFGDVWLAWRLWQAVGFDRLLVGLLPRGREAVPWATMAAVLVIARLCAPSSELHIAEDWFRRTALSDLLGVAEEKVNDDRLYRALDQVLPHKAALEAHLKERLGALFGLTYDQLLLRGAGRGQPPGPAGLLARSPPGLQAGPDRPGGQPRRLPAGLRDLRGQPQRRHHRPGGRHRAGRALRPGQPHLGPRPRHGQRQDPHVAARAGLALSRRHSPEPAQAVRQPGAGGPVGGSAPGVGGAALP